MLEFFFPLLLCHVSGSQLHIQGRFGLALEAKYFDTS